MNLNKTLNLLTICAKAGKLIGGFDKSMGAVKEGKSAAILLACDVSEKTAKEVRFLCEKYGSVPVIETDLEAFYFDKFMRKNKIIGFFSYIKNVLIRFAGHVLVPRKMKKKMYAKFLRKSAETAENK